MTGTAWKAVTFGLFFTIGMQGGNMAVFAAISLFVGNNQYPDEDDLLYWGLAGLASGFAAKQYGLFS